LYQKANDCGDHLKKPSYSKTVRMGARLLFQGRVAITFDQLDFHQHDIPFVKRLNFLVQGMQLIKRSGHYLGIPPILQIEPSNTCNLQCLTCATGAGLITRPATMMPYDIYRRVIDQVKDHVFLLIFWSWGEPFINKDAFRMIRYAKEKGLLVHTSTNGHYFETKERVRQIIESGLDSLIVAIDGLDQQTYEKYRKGGNLQKVISFIENLVAERASLGADNPRITLRFIVMKHNEHQVDQVKEFAQNLGVDVVTFRAAVFRRSDIDLEENLMPLSSDFQRFQYKNSPPKFFGKNQTSNYCHRPYANLTIFSNGDVVTCENDFNATIPLGNVIHQDIHEILSSSEVKKFFKVFRKDLDRFVFCRECENRYIEGDTANVQTLILEREFSKNEKNH
jgi:radical SAM protein with 4Fe4S-binding SPASM domain